MRYKIGLMEAAEKQLGSSSKAAMARLQRPWNSKPALYIVGGILFDFFAKRNPMNMATEHT